MKPPTLGSKTPAPGLISALAPTSRALPNNDFFQEFIRTCIEKVQDQAPTGKARDKFDKSLKLRNLNLYYGYLHIECYYFCQQYEDHFEFAGS